LQRKKIDLATAKIITLHRKNRGFMRPQARLDSPAGRRLNAAPGRNPLVTGA
jgi:hypothetical protein